MEQLIQLEQKLIEKAKAQSEAVHVAEQASTAYETALEKIMVANPELRALMTSEINAKSAAKEAKEQYSVEKFNAVQALIELTDPEDIKSIDTFSYRTEKSVWFDQSPDLIKRITKIEAFGLLQLNTKALTAFVKANAIKGDDGYELPKWLSKQYDNLISVEDEIKPTISDIKIAAKADKPPTE